MSRLGLTTPTRPLKQSTDVCDSPEFENFYSFLTKEERSKIKKYENNDRMFSKVMRGLRENNTQTLYLPRNFQNLRKFIELLKDRNQVENLVKNKDQPVDNKIEGITKLFELTRDFQVDNTGICLFDAPIKKPKRTPSFAHKPQDEIVLKRKLLGLNYDDYNNPDLAFKKLTKMSQGIEQYNQEIVKKKTISKKQISGKGDLKDKTASSSGISSQPYGNFNNAQNINVRTVLKEQTRNPSCPTNTIKMEKTRSRCLKKRMEIYEKKLQNGFNLSRPFQDLSRLHPKNFTKLKKEISSMVSKANKVYGLKIRCPKDLDFSDDKIKDQILNIKAQFVSKTQKPTLHENSRRQKSDIFDQSVPAELLREVTNNEQQSLTPGKTFFRKIWTSCTSKRPKLHDSPYNIIRF